MIFNIYYQFSTTIKINCLDTKWGYIIYSMRKNTISQRLNIIKGQLDGLGKLIDDNSDCQKVMAQFKAINAALKKVIEIYLKENLECCMKGVKKNKDAEFLLKELIESK